MTDTRNDAEGRYVLEYDAAVQWLIMNDPEGASRVIARDVPPDDAAYLIAGYEALCAAAQPPSGDAPELREALAQEIEGATAGLTEAQRKYLAGRVRALAAAPSTPTTPKSWESQRAPDATDDRPAGRSSCRSSCLPRRRP